MIIFFDLATVLIVILCICLAVGGGVMAAVSYVLAHMTTVILILCAVGLVIGAIAAFLSFNVWELFPFAVSFPPTVLYPLIVGVPFLKNVFEEGFFTGIIYTLLAVIPLLIGWLIVFLIGPVAVCGIGESCNKEHGASPLKSCLVTLLGGFGCVGLQYLALLFAQAIFT